MNNAQLINQDSGNVEYYTPGFIVESARVAMGGIDLDPASSATANERVKAGSFFSQADDGLSRKWFGNVWLNHPFGRRVNRSNEKWAEICAAKGVSPDAEMIPGNADWIAKIQNEYAASNFDQLCCITFAATSEEWFQPLMGRPQCYLCPRTNYHLPDGTVKKGVSKGSVVSYWGKNHAAFAEAFRAFGRIKIPA